MGFHVTTLHNLPMKGIQYFVHVLDVADGTHAKWINENLNALARAFGPDAGLVTGPQILNDQLYHFLRRNVADNFGAIEVILRRATCLIVSEGHLIHTQRPVFLLPLAFPESTNDAHEMIDTLLHMLADAMQNGTLEDLFAEFGAVKVGLTPVGGGLIVCTLRHLNSILELKPNLSGLGFNLNVLIEKALPPVVRKV